MDRGVGMTVPSAARCFTTIAVFLMLFSQVTGNLVVAPENRVALVGQRVQLDCSTNDTLSVNWLHSPRGSSSSRDVYISRTVVNSYHPRFTVQRKELANNVITYNLIMTDVQMKDAGTYRCVDRTGMGEQRDAELTVLGSLPKCTTNIGSNGFICENDCHNPIEKIHCSCSIEYAGNIAPEMQWTTTSVQDTIQPQPFTNVSEKTVSSELNITATKSMDGALVTWHLTQSTQINWTSMAIKILYARHNYSPLILSQSESVTCAANSSQHCNYTWIVKMDSENELQKIERQTLQVKKPGTYYCHAHCPLHHTPCTVVAMHVEYRNADENEKQNSVINALRVIIILTSCMVIGLVVVLVLVRSIYIKKLKKELDRLSSLLASKNDLLLHKHTETFA